MVMLVVPISAPGTKRSQYVDENSRAAEISLTPQDIDRLEEIARPSIVLGERYDKAAMAKFNL